jgi:hypothetical protein
MGTKLLSSSGGKEFDGTDYIYVYGDSDPLTNGQELQSALFQAGIDKVATGRRQTVVVGPGTYIPGQLGSYFQQDPQATSIVGLTDNVDVKLQHAGANRIASLNSSSVGSFSFNTQISEQMYQASLVYTSLGSNTRCYSDYIDLEDGSVILYNESPATGYRFIKITNTGYVVGQPLSIFYPNFNIDRYWVIKNHATGLREIFAEGYYQPTNSRVLLKMDVNTLAYDPLFYVATSSNGFINDIVSTPDGGYVLVGQFTAINGTGCLNIAKVNSNGTYDSTFVTGTGFNSVASSVAINPNSNTLYVGGNFANYNGNTSSNRFAIIDATSGNSITLAEFPNSQVTAVKYFQATDKVYVFGYFNQWGGTSLNSRHAVVNSVNGTFNTVLFNEYIGNINNDSQVSGDIDGVCLYDAANKLRLYNANQSTFSVNGTATFYGSLLEIDVTNSTPIVSYSLLPLVSYYGTNAFVAYNAYATSNGFVLTSGSFYYGNMMLLYSSTNIYWNSSGTPSSDIRNLDIGGALVVNTQYVSQIKIDNCYIRSATDIASYNNSSTSNQITITGSNSKIENVIGCRGIDVDNFIINNAYVPLPTLLSGMMSFGFVNAKNSSLYNMYNSRGAYIMGVNLQNSQLYSSFCNGFEYSTGYDFLNIGQVNFKNCLIESCFLNSMAPNFLIYNSQINYSFQLNYPNNVSLTLVRDAGWSWRGEIHSSTLSNGFIYEFQNVLYEPVSTSYFSQIDMQFYNCDLNNGSLSFVAIPASITNRLYFVNCNHLDQALRSMYVSILPSTSVLGYEWGSGNFGNIKFVNCHTVDVNNAFVVKVYVPFSVGQLYLYDISFDGCTYQMSNLYGGPQTNSVFNFDIETTTGSGYITDLIFHKVRAFNCTASSDFILNAFFSNYYNLQNLQILDGYFKDCTINHTRAVDYTVFTSNAFFSGISASNLIVANIAQGLVFENCSTVSQQTATYAYTPTIEYAKAYANGFLANLTIGSFSSNSGFAVKFLKCQADSGFFNGYNSISGNVYIYAKDSNAMWGRAFGKKALVLGGTFINCDGNSESLGDAYFDGSNYRANYKNARFIGCVGATCFGLDLSTSILFAGELYHNTALNGPNTISSIAWNSQAYNVN